jgi:hypothetical protein
VNADNAPRPLQLEPHEALANPFRERNFREGARRKRRHRLHNLPFRRVEFLAVQPEENHRRQEGSTLVPIIERMRLREPERIRRGELGTKIIAIGAIRAMDCASCPAPLGIRCVVRMVKRVLVAAAISAAWRAIVAKRVASVAGLRFRKSTVRSTRPAITSRVFGVGTTRPFVATCRPGIARLEAALLRGQALQSQTPICREAPVCE